MNDVRRSLVEYLATVAKAWWQLAIGLVAAAFGVATLFKSGLIVPGWVAVAVAVVALFLAQFQAFHSVRLARDQAAGPRALRGLPGMLNEFSGSLYWPNQVGSRLQPDEDGMTVRVVLGPRNTKPGVQIDSRLKNVLRLALDASPLEWWFQTRTSTASPWAIQSPTTHYLATVVRLPSPDAIGPASLEGDCQFQLPSLRVVLMVDVVVRAQAGDGRNRFRFSRLDIYELCHLLIGTAMDVVAPAVFPAITEPRRRRPFRKLPPLIGPSVFLTANGQKNLSDFIDLADLHRAPGANPGHINTTAAIETPILQRLDTFAARDRLVKEGLKTTLSASEFLNVEGVIDSLRLSPNVERVLSAVQSKR